MGLAPYDRTGAMLGTDVPGYGVKRSFRAHFQVSAANAAAPSATAVLAATALTASAQTITTNITSPTAPRNITVTGNASGIAGNVTVKGTNFSGASIAETLALNGTSTVAGNKAFKTVTEIDLPVKTNSSGDTVSVGIGSKLGLPYKLAHNTVDKAYLDNAKESTDPTVTTDASAMENNTVTLSSSLAGKVVDVYLDV